jgi:hypothetical protein
MEARYRGGTGYALDAGMHGSGNLMFVAAVPKELCGVVESELIWRGRHVLVYNNQGKRLEPVGRIGLSHEGNAPSFAGFEAPRNVENGGAGGVAPAPGRELGMTGSASVD